MKKNSRNGDCLALFKLRMLNAHDDHGDHRTIRHRRLRFVMSSKTTLLGVLMTTTLLAGGIAVAANQGADHPMPSADAAGSKVTTAERDLSKLSVDGARGIREVGLARVAIFEGHTEQAKKLVQDATAAFSKARQDDAVFIKADASLTSAPGEKSEQAASDAKTWLPVDAVVSLDEDYTASAAKTKAVAEANEHLRHGDRKAAMEKLKLADVGMSVVQEVLPLQQTLSDIHQAATLIDQGKYYEGSQELRKLQANARFDVATYVSGTNGKVTYSHMSDASATNTAMANGPEPYSAPDPQYKPMTSEPLIQPQKSAPISLTDGESIQGPAAGPEPYSAPTPQYKPMTSEPLVNPTKTAPPSLTSH